MSPTAGTAVEDARSNVVHSDTFTYRVAFKGNHGARVVKVVRGTVPASGTSHLDLAFARTESTTGNDNRLRRLWRPSRSRRAPSGPSGAHRPARPILAWHGMAHGRVDTW